MGRLDHRRAAALPQPAAAQARQGPARRARGLGLNENNRNKEIRFAWLDLAVANRYDPAVPSLERFLTSQGRGKFVKPLIRALAKDSQWGRPIAKRIYAEARPLYHPLVTRDLDKLNL